MRLKYKKKPDQYVIAVQLAIETEGFSYKKWGSMQKCKAGDWLINNDDDIYTIDKNVFENTYRKIEDGKYVKTTPIWGEQATKDGSVNTKEGKSHYNAGDYLVSNNEDGTDAYCISAEKFTKMYEEI